MMKVIFILLFLASLCFGQNQNNTKIFWEGQVLGNYFPKLYSNSWETTALGGQIAFRYKNNEKLTTNLLAKTMFVPTIANNNLDFTSVKNIGLHFLLNVLKKEKTDLMMIGGLSYTNGKINHIISKSIDFNLNSIFTYKITEKVNVFGELGAIYTFKKDFLTPSFAIGFIADFIIISFELNQFMDFNNLEARQIHSSAVPFLTNL